MDKNLRMLAACTMVALLWALPTPCVAQEYYEDVERQLVDEGAEDTWYEDEPARPDDHDDAIFYRPETAEQLSDIERDIELASYNASGGFLPPARDVPMLGPPLSRLGQAVGGPCPCGSGYCCDEGDGCCSCCSCRWWGLTGFAVADGWSSRLDDQHANNFGPRVGANLGMVLWGDIGGQVGVSYAGYDLHGREHDESANRVEEQLFFTAGVFRRPTCLGCDCWLQRVTWGVVYDQLVATHLGDKGDHLNISQFRFRVGLLLDCCNEVGVWGGGNLETRRLTNANRNTRAVDQINIFWRHKFCYGGETTFWAGLAEDPGEATIGANGEVPLNDFFALFGNFHYIIPSTSGGDDPDNAFSEEYWNVSFGITLYFGGCACRNSILDHRWMPLLPVADNGSFALEVPGGNF